MKNDENKDDQSVNQNHVLNPDASKVTSSAARDPVTVFMMTSSNGYIVRVTGPLYGEFIGHRWIPHTKASDAELWCFLWSAPE